MKLHIKVHRAGSMTLTSRCRVGKISEGTLYLFNSLSFIITSFNQAVHKLRTTQFGLLQNGLLHQPVSKLRSNIDITMLAYTGAILVPIAVPEV